MKKEYGIKFPLIGFTEEVYTSQRSSMLISSLVDVDDYWLDNEPYSSTVLIILSFFYF